jgi:hypothetical protein
MGHEGLFARSAQNDRTGRAKKRADFSALIRDFEDLENVKNSSSN